MPTKKPSSIIPKIPNPVDWAINKAAGATKSAAKAGVILAGAAPEIAKDTVKGSVDFASAAKKKLLGPTREEQYNKMLKERRMAKSAAFPARVTSSQRPITQSVYHITRKQRELGNMGTGKKDIAAYEYRVSRQRAKDAELKKNVRKAGPGV